MWQNNQLRPVLQVMDQGELDQDRGAFFGSLQQTLSHLLWGDTLWLSRFDARCAAPDCAGHEGLTRWANKAEWSKARQEVDARILSWADAISHKALDADLTWTYSYEDTEVTKPLGFCITHFFNHQTHHRGQIHAMLTAAGQTAPVSDLSYLPEDL
jgi:uncharacterized damage-inducible protein DinB